MPRGTEFDAPRHQKVSATLPNRLIKFGSVADLFYHCRQYFLPPPLMLLHRVAAKKHPHPFVVSKLFHIFAASLVSPERG